MKPSRFVNLLIVILVVIAFLAYPSDVSAVLIKGKPMQDITGNGQYCYPPNSCLELHITFNPAGGPVTGTWSGSYTPEGTTVINTETGTLQGTFEGGDGGAVSGTASIEGDVTFTEYTRVDHYTQSVPWNGNLYADGTGNGTTNSIPPGSIKWNITFSAADFQAALSAAIPTSEYVDILVGPPSVLVKSWPELDAAIAEILNQDDAIVGRDAQGVYYVIDNQGNQNTLPVEMQSVLQMNNEFGLLQNANLLWASPAVQAFVAANGNEAMDAITGSGSYQYYTIPEWLKQRQYIKVTTNCSGGNCSSYTTVSVLRSSLHFDPNALASSEHSSVRGTINGGGDFIFDPFLGRGIKLASPAYAPPGWLQNSVTRPYLGVQVLDSTDRAYIQMVQRGSPADDVGLAVDDQIVSVSGVNIDNSTNTLAALLDQYSGGDQVVLGVIRLGELEVTQVTVTLANLLPSVVVTPAAEITINDQTDFVVEIGLNGVTAVLVLADWAHVREPVTGSEADVPAGSMIIVVPGYEIGNPIPANDSDVTAWWDGEQQPTPSPDPNPTTVPDATWLLIGLACCFCMVVIVAVVVIILVVRKKRQPAAPPPYYPPRQ